MSNINNTIIKEEINNFLDDLGNPTYLRNEVRDYFKKSDLEMALSVIRDYKNKKSLDKLFNVFAPKKKVAW